MRCFSSHTMSICVRCCKLFQGRDLECRVHVGTKDHNGVWSCCDSDGVGCVRAQHTTNPQQREVGGSENLFVHRIDWDVARFGIPNRLSVYRELGIWEEKRWAWEEQDTLKQIWCYLPKQQIRMVTTQTNRCGDRRVSAASDMTEPPLMLTSGKRKRKRLEGGGRLLVNELDVAWCPSRSPSV